LTYPTVFTEKETTDEIVSKYLLVALPLFNMTMI